MNESQMPPYFLRLFAVCCNLQRLFTADRTPSTELQGFVGRGDTSFAEFAICSLSVDSSKRPQRAVGGGKMLYLACGTSGLRQDSHSQAPADSGVEGWRVRPAPFPVSSMLRISDGSSAAELAMARRGAAWHSC